jgi:hypothetical protein
VEYTCRKQEEEEGTIAEFEEESCVAVINASFRKKYGNMDAHVFFPFHIGILRCSVVLWLGLTALYVFVVLRILRRPFGAGAGAGPGAWFGAGIVFFFVLI